MYVFIKKLMIILAAAAIGDFAGMYQSNKHDVPPWSSTRRPLYRTVAATGTALVVYRDTRWLRLLLWPVAGFIVNPRLVDAFEGPGTASDRLNSERFGLRAGFALAGSSLLIGRLRRQ